MSASKTITKSLTIPAREVRPGDVLFGMTVRDAHASGDYEGLWCFGFAGQPLVRVHADQRVTVERPVPSDPIGTVRTDLNGTDLPVLVYVKVSPNEWEASGSQITRHDSDVADFPILWKPGMPIPSV